MKNLTGPGYDDNFCVTKSEQQGMTFVSRVVHPISGRTLEVYSDQPGVQLYTSNFLPDPCNNVSGNIQSFTSIDWIQFSL